MLRTGINAKLTRHIRKKRYTIKGPAPVSDYTEAGPDPPFLSQLSYCETLNEHRTISQFHPLLKTENPPVRSFCGQLYPVIFPIVNRFFGDYSEAPASRPCAPFWKSYLSSIYTACQSMKMSTVQIFRL